MLFALAGRAFPLVFVLFLPFAIARDINFSLTLCYRLPALFTRLRFSCTFAQRTGTMEVKSRKVLIADDEPDILEILKYNLEKEGYAVITAKDGDEALDKAKHTHPDLIVLDMMMPRKSGMEVCEILRAQSSFKDTLIMFLTALSDETTQLKGFDTGADDYITKPVSPSVFVSKVNALLRRVKPVENKNIQMGALTIDPERFLVIFEGKEILLAKKEFELLYYLASKPGRVFLRNEILSQVWGNDVIVGDRTIDVHIRKIRQKLGVDCITTVKGVGYKFEL
jgi:two-component system, OmpR family, alkaline phosphatase synthesis response regulator PhoP